MKYFVSRTRRIMAAAALAGSLLVVGMALPRSVSANHWGTCLSDPMVWLDNGAKLDLGSSVQTDSSNVAHFSYTLHVPSGTQAVKIQRTRGASASYESVNVVSDTSGGYTADVLATSSDGNSYAVTFSIHVTDKGSAWYSADGTTNQDVAVSIPAS